MNWRYILIVIILAVILGGGILAYQYWWLPKEEAKISETKPPEVKAPEEVPPEEIPEDETADWKTYRNKEYGFEIKYPTEYALEENVEKITDFGEEGDYAEILLNKTIIDSRCYKSSIQKVYIGINETDNTFAVCSKEKVFAPTSNEEYIRGISLQLTEEGWPEIKEVNDIIFYRRYFVTHSMGGKAYPDYAYQSFHNNKCYKIGLEVYSSSAFGFMDECPPSLRDSYQYKSLFENEDEKIQETFFPILSTFRFLE